VLIVEVSSTTLEFDRSVKVPIVRHAVAEVRGLDVSSQRIHVYRSPQDGVFTATETFPLATRVLPVALGSELDLRPLAARLAQAD
jgi:hypothetical protein